MSLPRASTRPASTVLPGAAQAAAAETCRPGAVSRAVAFREDRRQLVRPLPPPVKLISVTSLALLRPALCLAAVLLASTSALAQAGESARYGVGATGVVAVPVYVFPPWGYGLYGDCAFYGACLGGYSAARTYDQRREQVRRQREEIATPKPPLDLRDGSGGPWGYARRTPPPTPESEIQPQYRDSGQVLPQYRDSGTR